MHYNLPVHCGGKRYGTKKAKTDGRNSIGQFGGERDLGSAVIMFFNAERMNDDLMGVLYCPGRAFLGVLLSAAGIAVSCFFVKYECRHGKKENVKNLS